MLKGLSKKERKRTSIHSDENDISKAADTAYKTKTSQTGSRINKASSVPVLFATCICTRLFPQRNTKDSPLSPTTLRPHLLLAIDSQRPANEERLQSPNDFPEADATQTGLSLRKVWRLLQHPGSPRHQLNKKTEKKKKSAFPGESCDTSVSLRQKKSQRILGGMQRNVASFLSQSSLFPFPTTV